MMGVPANKRLSALIYVVGFAVLYGFVMRMFFRAEDSLMADELMADDMMSASDDILSMLGEIVGTAVDAVTNTADVLSETLGVKPKATRAAKAAAKAAKAAGRQAAAIRRTAWYHHFLRGLVIGLLAWNAIAILAFPPTQDLLGSFGFPEPKINASIPGLSYSGSGVRNPITTRSYTPYYRSAASAAAPKAYSSSGVQWTPVSRCGR
jgi:hypothetical protein